MLVPLTGFVALEGTSQRNGALLAASQLRDVTLKPEVLDTAATPEAAVTAWERAMGGALPSAVVGPILGTQMLALLPLAQERGVPLLTISGTARLGELGNPWFFRFFPSDATVKVAHARYVVEKLGAKRPAVIYQSTAYGQSGREQLARTFADLKTPPVLEESIAPTVNDLSPAHAARQERQRRRDRAAPACRLDGAGRAPGAPAPARPADRRRLGDAPARDGGAARAGRAEGRLRRDRGIADLGHLGTDAAFLDAYRAAYKSEPDAFAAAQFDAVGMLGKVIADLRKAGQPVTPKAVRDRLASDSYHGRGDDLPIGRQGQHGARGRDR